MVVGRAEQPEHSIFWGEKAVKTSPADPASAQDVNSDVNPVPAAGTAGSSPQLEPRRGPIAEQRFVKPGSALLGFKGQPGVSG